MNRCAAGWFARTTVFLVFALLFLPMTGLFLVLLVSDSAASGHERLLYVPGVRMGSGMTVFGGYRMLYLGPAWLEL